MSKVEEHDEQETSKLDEHFKLILIRVRSCVLNLRSTEEAYLCGLWLDKLNSIISQRSLRNEYLFELSRQLRAGVLEGIFKTQPPDDSLMPLPSPTHAVCTSSSLSESSDYYDRDCRNRGDYSSNKVKVNDSNSSPCARENSHRDEDARLEAHHLRLREHRIDMLTGALENLRIQNEGLKRELMKNQEKTINEALRSRNRVRQLTAQAQTQSLVWKVQMLKKTVAKLRKLNNIIEHIYEKKLQRVIKNKNLEIKILQLHFQEQTSELCLSLNSEKQNELCSLVGSLEEKYKALLTAANATAKSQRHEYFTKIGILEAELCHLRNKFGSTHKPKYT